MGRARKSGDEESGQVLALVLVILLIVSTLVPLMVMYSQRESIWTAKQAQSTRAFHLAESGIEKGYLELSLSTQTWVTLMKGGANSSPTHYAFDKTYQDVNGGTYTISITSGPQSQQATVISIGRDNLGKETRSIQAVYSNSPLGGIAIYAGAGTQVANGVTVEWGGVVSPNQIDPGGLTYPTFRSASYITGYDTDPNPPNTDNCIYYAYQKNIPPNPILDLNFYKSSATLATGCPAGGTGCYYSTAQNWNNVTVNKGQTIYIDGNMTLSPPGIDVVGNLLVMGNLDTGSGVWGNGNHTMKMPTDAWKQYCGNWSHYKNTFDSGAPSTYPGNNGTYTSPTGCLPTTACTSKKLSVYGLLYVQGYFLTGGGGGQADVYGTMYVVSTATMTNKSGVTFYYDADAAQNMQTTQIILYRTSWKDVVNTWPNTTP